MSNYHAITLVSHAGKKYQLEGGEDNILQTGLRLGFNLRYGCNNGNCGACKAWLVSGSTSSEHHDYVLSEQDKAQKMILMCCHTPTSDITIKTQMQDELPEIPKQLIEVKIKEINFLNDDLIILHLKMPRSKTLQYIAGQEASLSLPNDVFTSYPIASCPCLRTELEFHIRRNPKDNFASALFNKTIKKRDLVLVSNPKGIFHLEEQDNKPITFIAWDIAFPPIRSIIEHHYYLDFDTKVDFYWGYPDNEKSPYLENYAKSWCALFDNYKYRSIACEFERNSDNDYIHIATQLFNGICLAEIKQSVVYLAAPATIVINLSGMLVEAGVDPTQLKAFPI